MTRKVYLDWLRGIAVIVMVEAHLFDSWVRPADRSEPPFRWAIGVGGFSAPLFLFLAGVALVLAAGSRMRRGATFADAGAVARRRGSQILALAFLFRLQSFAISGGAFPETLLKVDILNVMGLSMLLAAALWSAGARAGGAARGVQMTALAAAGVTFAAVTPLVRTAALPSWLPSPLASYLVSVPGSGAFTLFPWVGFLLAGSVVGLWLDRADTDRRERRLMAMLALAGTVVGLAGYAASFMPPLYPATTFWTGSPTFFFVRLGVLLTAVPLAYLWCERARARSPLREMGVASLFVYWIHVEMVYGVASIWLHRALSFGQAAVACVAFCVFLYALVRLKDRLVDLPRTLPSVFFRSA